MTVEGLKTVFDWFAIILLFLTFASGVGVLITGNIINKRQAAQLMQFDSDLTVAKLALGKQEHDNLVLRTDLNNQSGKVAGLQTDASNAKAAQQRVEVELAEQQARAASLELKAEELKRDNLTLESELSPRWFREQQDAIARLRPFAGTHVVLEYLVDFECRRTAEQIAFVLGEAKWTYSPKPNPDPDIFFREGISVIGQTNGMQELIDELNKSGLDAESSFWPGAMPNTAIPQGQILVRVGMKPSAQEKREMKPINDAITAFNKAVDEAVRERKPMPSPGP